MIPYHSLLQDVFNKHPILFKFLVYGLDEKYYISSILINNYLGEKVVSYREKLTSSLFETVLNKIYNSNN